MNDLKNIDKIQIEMIKKQHQFTEEQQTDIIEYLKDINAYEEGVSEEFIRNIWIKNE